MKRLALIALLAAVLIFPVSAGAQSKSPTPGECSWQLNGFEEDGWICLCQRVNVRGEWQVWCAWHLTDTVDGAVTSRKVKPKRVTPKVRVLVRPVFIHA